jgi:hypothetical protein
LLTDVDDAQIPLAGFVLYTMVQLYIKPSDDVETTGVYPMENGVIALVLLQSQNGNVEGKGGGIGDGGG